MRLAEALDYRFAEPKITEEIDAPSKFSTHFNEDQPH